MSNAHTNIEYVTHNRQIQEKREDCEVKEAWGTFTYIPEQGEEKQQTP